MCYIDECVCVSLLNINELCCCRAVNWSTCRLLTPCFLVWSGRHRGCGDTSSLLLLRRTSCSDTEKPPRSDNWRQFITLLALFCFFSVESARNEVTFAGHKAQEMSTVRRLDSATSWNVERWTLFILPFRLSSCGTATSRSPLNTAGPPPQCPSSSSRERTRWTHTHTHLGGVIPISSNYTAHDILWQ